MSTVLIQAAAFVLIIIIGITLRRTGVVAQDAGQSVKKILINVTLPCAIIVNFAKVGEAGPEMMLLTLMGILTNMAMIAVGILVTRGRERGVRAMYMLCLPAINIGAFCLPFVQSFLPALGTVTACMFDVGNSIMCTGGTYAFTAEYTAEEKKGFDLKAMGKRLITSPPLISYVTMFLLTSVHITLPQVILTLITPMANANTFVAMLMIGLLFHLELKKEYLGEILRILSLRHLFAIAMALLIYFLLPFDLVIRQTLVLVCFGPLSAVAPAYTGMCGGDEGMASAANSISIITSIAELTLLLILMGLY